MAIPISESELHALQQLVGDSSKPGEAGRYRPLSLLGKTSGRKTLLAEDAETKAKVVIKLLTFGEDFAWDDLKLFEREAETLRSLEHSAIPRYLDYFEVETPRSKGFALVQSYIEARSLAEQAKAGRRFSEEDLEQIAQQLLDILEYLHSRQPAVIHRDIKPSNILLTDRTAHSVGQVYLVDFGSVQTLAAREGSTVTVVGTYGYMPPEQFGGRTVPASDLYSLGATLIYLASGQHPADLPQKQLQLQFQDLVQLSEPMVQWLQRMTQPDLEQRFGSVAEAREQPKVVAMSGSEVALVPAPAHSQIKLQRTGDRNLRIQMPAGRLRLRKIQRKIGFFQVMGVTLVGIFGFIIVMFLFLGEIFAGNNDLGWLVLIGLLWLVFLVVLAFRWRRIATEFRSGHFDLAAGKISICWPGVIERQFQARQAWQLNGKHRCLSLYLGRWELLFKGNGEELHWLESHLQAALRLEAGDGLESEGDRSRS